MNFNNIPKILSILMFICAITLMINHWYRGLFWEPLAIIWLLTIPMVITSFKEV